MEVVTIFDFLPHCGDVDDIFFWWFGEVRSTENTICIQEDNGEAESAKSEMMVASSVLCDLTPHCFVICDRRDRE